MWVVCRRCERWNLSPLEERWEAIEDCERLFRGTRLRVSTDNIGLARVGDGLELVRVGEPLRPELAAWRYGDQFGRRRRRTVAYTGLGVAAGVGLLVVGPIVGGVASLSWSSYNVFNAVLNSYQRRRIRARLTVPGHDLPIPIRRDQIGHLALVHQDQSWGLRVSFEDEEVEHPNLLGRVWPRERHVSSILITGDEALRAAAKLMPTVNATGARRRDIAAAVDILTETPDPSHLFARYAAAAPSWSKSGQYVSYLSRPARLALEMASHEESERRALEGELHLLESAWREAEEIASIADGLLLPADTDDRYEALKREARDL
ncbi:MAG TPA: hypothetical protein VNC18_19290 [Gemmatimonadaceae bacterium]|nr:hypothetical protein [Gemmatimonadaceae bacterium]